MQKLILSFFLSAGVIMLSGCSGSNMTPVHQEISAGRAAPASLPGVEAGSQTDSADPADSSRTAKAGSEADSVTSAPHMIFIRGLCLTDTGREAYVTCGTTDGEITAVTADDKAPETDGEANFDCIGAPYIALADGAAAVLLDDRYQLFLADNLVEYQGVYKQKKDVSADTLKWLDFYYTMSETERDALSMVPDEFSEALSSSLAAVETASTDTSYLSELTEEELSETEALAQVYFTEDVPVFEGVDQIYPLDRDALYHNVGLEGEYAPGNIIIYKVLTVKDRRDGNPFRSISIARRTKSDAWKIINCGY
ncbi:MAG: hypothetical protein PHV18_08575 [Lachnospiraceae bacterium]|nr:hypothetical protein [Lachnospiraceae bacterium]